MKQEEKKLPEGVEEAAQKVEDYYDVGEEHGYLCCHRGDIKNTFIAGAEWMKSKMLEQPASDDEQTRKDIIAFILNRAGYLLDENTEHRFIAYLEKQKEK